MEKLDSCWQWRGTISPNGYGQFCHRRVRQSAHRAAYELYVGPIPAGYSIDHLCLNRSCVNPEHLEAVPPSVNSRRTRRSYPRPLARLAPTADPERHRLERECKNGHPRTPENTAYDAQGKPRRCLICRREGRRKPGGYKDPARERATHCPQGHEYTPENTYEYERGGRKYRYCRECNRAAARRRASPVAP